MTTIPDAASRPAPYARLGITAVVFDFDGTLAASTLDFAHMRARAATAMRRHATVPDRPDMPTMELLALVCAGLPERAAREVRETALAAVREVELEAARTSALFAFVRPMFAACLEKNIATGIITRNCPEAVRTIFPDVDEFCSCLLTRDHVPLVKPDPDHLFRALGLLRKTPAETLMVGDHPMDIETGRRAGALTAAVHSGESSLARLAAHAPDYLAKDAGALMRLLGILEDVQRL